MALSIAQTAKALTEQGFATFPLNLDGTPRTEQGFKDASVDPFYTFERFEKYGDKARIGIATGMSGLVVLDLDYKEDVDGNVLKDGYESLAESWLDVPESYGYTSAGGKGRHIWFQTPEGKVLPRKLPYRKMTGVDRCSGDGYVVFNGTDVPKREDLAPAPEWLCDEGTARTEDRYTGTVKEWYYSLEQGEPSLIVRSAMDRARKTFADNGDDFSHGDIVERQHEAVRLGAEGHPGVPALLDLLEDLMMERTGAHSRPEEEWQHEFQEALASGVKKYGAAIQLRSNLPAFDISTVPAGVPDRLLVGTPGDKSTFTDLLRELQKASDDDLYVTSVLWNSARTRDLAREWGLEFVHQRVLSARSKPEPVRENPTVPEIQPPTAEPKREVTPTTGSVMTPEEWKRANAKRTFIDSYLEASALKGFSVPAYDIPGAWTALSMVMGPRAITAYNGVGVNLWFIEAGGTGTGKTSSIKFLKGVLDLCLKDGEGYYNVGASSSPSAIHEELLTRDGKASMVLHDEAASFFSDLHNTEWMKTLEHHFSSFYDGDVEPSNKIRLPKELRGKHARTSFNLNMAATHDKLFALVTTAMFETGFLSRVNWTWAPKRPETDERFSMGPSEVDANLRTHPVTYDLSADLLSAAASIPLQTVVGGTPEAWKRLSEAAKYFHEATATDRQYEVLQGPLTRLRETTVKCAALLALYEGRTEFNEDDVLVTLKYAEEWFQTCRRVVNEASESEFSRDAAHIEAYVRANTTVSEAKILHQFKGIIKNNSRELTDRLNFLVESGRLLRKAEDRRVMYEING